MFDESTRRSISIPKNNFLQVTGVVGRAETLSSLFYLAALITYTKCCRSKRSTGERSIPTDLHNSRLGSCQFSIPFSAGWRSLILSMFFVFIAMLCKEQGITATAVCVLYEIFVVQRVSLKAKREFKRRADG